MGQCGWDGVGGMVLGQGPGGVCAAGVCRRSVPCTVWTRHCWGCAPLRGVNPTRFCSSGSWAFARRPSARRSDYQAAGGRRFVALVLALAPTLAGSRPPLHPPLPAERPSRPCSSVSFLFSQPKLFHSRL